MKRHEVENAVELSLRIEPISLAEIGSDNGLEMEKRVAIVDCEQDIVALVLKEHSIPLMKVLEWGIENYPYEPYKE